MPTGYTEKIVSGEVTEFKDFAKLCLRAFGSCIHMRDTSLDTPYRNREYNTYYIKELDKLKIKLKDLNSKSDLELTEEYKKEIEDDIKYYEEQYDNILKNNQLLKSMLEKVNKWIPPTKEHEGIKTFMTLQLTDSIEDESRSSYYKEELNRLKSISITDEEISNIRKDKIEYFKSQILKYERDIEEDKIRCDKNNLFNKQFFDSLK